MKFTEIKHDYMYGPAVENRTPITSDEDLLAAVTIDAWESDKYDAQGRVLATVVLTKSGDIVTVYHDNGVRMFDPVTEHINAAKEELRAVWADYSAKRKG